MRSTNVAENGRKCDYMLNFWSPVRYIDVVENDCNRTFRLPLTDHVILRSKFVICCQSLLLRHWPAASHCHNWTIVMLCCTAIQLLSLNDYSVYRIMPCCHEGEFQSWQCEFFEQRKAPLGWTAVILVVCEETTIGTKLGNSFNMSYCVTVSTIINMQGNN